MSEGAELEYLRQETRDLNEKLETLRMKRREDKEKLAEYEKNKIQLAQLIEYRERMSEIHAKLQRELQAAQKARMLFHFKQYPLINCRTQKTPKKLGKNARRR